MSDDDDPARLARLLRDDNERLRNVIIRVRDLLENELGGFYLSAPSGTPLCTVRRLLRIAALPTKVAHRSTDDETSREK